jgi:hypothetical protein
MVMRSKVAIIRGFNNISPHITVAPVERINADNVVLITALKYPQTLPERWAEFTFDPTSLLVYIKEIMEFWSTHDNEHLVTAEYASVAIDRIGKTIRAVEGESLEVDWFYDTVRNYHRHFGQTVIDCVFEIESDPNVPLTKRLIIDGVEFTLEDGIERLKPCDTLG